MSIITYSEEIKETDYMNLDSFRDFVNVDGGGQYFFEPMNNNVYSFKNIFSSLRLRTSIIENNYLVMSPNRVGAGLAYLDLYYDNEINLAKFDLALWSNNEYITSPKLYIDSFWNYSYREIIEIPLTKLNQNKDNKSTFYVLLPNNTSRLRFRTVNANPTADRNKGRVCIDNIYLYS